MKSSIFTLVIFSALFVFDLLGADALVLTIEDVRPIAKVIEELEHRYGWAITYEDPRLIYQGDLVDDTRPAARARLGSLGLRAKGGHIDVTYDLSPDDSKSATSLIQSII
jgi:hypothetical protein